MNNRRMQKLHTPVAIYHYSDKLFINPLHLIFNIPKRFTVPYRGFLKRFYAFHSRDFVIEKTVLSIERL